MRSNDNKIKVDSAAGQSKGLLREEHTKETLLRNKVQEQFKDEPDKLGFFHNIFQNDDITVLTEHMKQCESTTDILKNLIEIRTQSSKVQEVYEILNTCYD